MHVRNSRRTSAPYRITRREETCARNCVTLLYVTLRDEEVIASDGSAVDLPLRL